MHSPSPCQLSDTMLFHSLALCVTHHGNKCVHRFEDCHHDSARLSNFPPHIAMPRNHPPNNSAPVQEKSLEDSRNYKYHYCIRCFAVSILSVTSERQLQPPGPLLAQSGFHRGSWYWET